MNRQDKIHALNVELINMMLDKHGVEVYEKVTGDEH